jgi:hypothetical protein
VAKPATPGATSGDLHGQAIVHCLAKGHYWAGWKGHFVQIQDYSALDLILTRARDLDPRDLGQTGQDCLSSVGVQSGLQYQLTDLDYDFLPISDDQGIKERGYRGGIGRIPSPGNDKWVALPLRGPQGETGQIQHV